MKKLMLLIRVLFKCGRVGKAEKSNSAVGDSKMLITLAIGLAAIVGMFLAGQYAAGHMQLLGSGNVIFSTVLTAAGMIAFFMTMMNAVNQLYISSDLDVLTTMPFTPMQIVTAKLLSVSVYPIGICFALVAPAAVGFAMKTTGLSAMFVPVMIIGVLLLSVYVVALVASLLMIVMRVFRFVRSRNMVSVLSTLVVFALTIGYCLFSANSQELDESQAVGMFNMLSGFTASLGFLFPTIGFTVNAAFGQLSQLLYAVLIAVCALALLFILAKTIYFSAALGMTDANGKRGAISAADMKKYTAGESVGKTLARREIRQILRTPAMITNGYLYSIVVPFIIVIPLVLKAREQLFSAFEGSGVPVTLDLLRELVREANLQPPMFLIAGALFGLIMAALAVSLSCLSRFMISREGKDFAVLKTMPFSGRKLVSVKRNVTMAINGISGFIIPAAVYIALAATGMVPVWICAVCLVVSFAWLRMFVNICASVDVAKPNLNWETETDVMKNNYTGMILLVASFAVLIGSVFLLVDKSDTIQSLDVIMAVALCAVPVIGAVVTELRLGILADRLF